MIAVKHIDPDDLPLYAMHLLPEDENQELKQQLQHSTEARRILSEIYGDLAVLAHTAEPYSPTAAARQRLMNHVAREKKVVAIDRASQPDYSARPVAPEQMEVAPRGVSSRMIPWLGWAAAAGIAVQAGLLYQQKETLQHVVENQHAQLAETMTSAEFSNRILETLKDPSAQNVVLTPGEGHVPPQGRATYNSEKGSLIFFASNLEPLNGYKTYELWLLPANGQSPIPAGTFHPDSSGNAVVILPTLPRGTAAKGFGITIESGTGSATPTLPIILKGATA